MLKVKRNILDTGGMHRRSHAIVSMIIALSLLVTSCGEDAMSPDVELEAHWQCDVQRMTFDDLTALDAELETRIAEAGMTREDYAAFKERLGESIDLRRAVGEEYDEYCHE